jgi:PleD family two-component response regulator
MKTPNTHRQTILVVDDDSGHRILAQKVLEQAGFRVDVADNGKEALEIVARSKPDLMILDVLMPGLDGFSVCTQLRQDPNCRDLPILMATGLEDVNSIEQAFEVGATHFVTKPINWTLLVYHVRYILRSAEMERDLREILRFISSVRQPSPTSPDARSTFTDPV